MVHPQRLLAVFLDIHSYDTFWNNATRAQQLLRWATVWPQYCDNRHGRKSGG